MLCKQGEEPWFSDHRLLSLMNFRRPYWTFGWLFFHFGGRWKQLSVWVDILYVFLFKVVLKLIRRKLQLLSNLIRILNIRRLIVVAALTLIQPALIVKNLLLPQLFKVVSLLVAETCCLGPGSRILPRLSLRWKEHGMMVNVSWCFSSALAHLHDSLWLLYNICLFLVVLWL
jgi:hypothetical protein